MAEPGAARNVSLSQAAVIVLLGFEKLLLRIRLLGRRVHLELERHHSAQVRFRNKQSAGESVSFGGADSQRPVLVSWAGTPPWLKGFAAQKRFLVPVEHGVGLQRLDHFPG